MVSFFDGDRSHDPYRRGGSAAAGRDTAAAFAVVNGHEPDRLSRWPVSLLFFSREETRLHIHVQSTEGEAKVWIGPEIELAKNYELSDQDLSRVLQLVEDHEQEIRDAWHKHFGS